MHRLGLAGFLVIALSLPAAASAARQPTHPERAAITRVLNGAKVPRACFPLKIKVSTRNARYAAAEYRSVNACGIVVGNGVSVLKRIGYQRWQIVVTGSDLACNGGGRVPPAVMADLIGGRCSP
jgi:hypothetical protein